MNNAQATGPSETEVLAVLGIAALCLTFTVFYFMNIGNVMRDLKYKWSGGEPIGVLDFLEAFFFPVAIFWNLFVKTRAFLRENRRRHWAKRHKPDVRVPVKGPYR